MSEEKPQGGAAPEPAPMLATDLAGNLPCIGCGYDLKGLSIRARCPECGTAVRATILACVDPMAEELLPLRRPRLAAYGMILWSWAAIAAALSVWAQRLMDALAIWRTTPIPHVPLPSPHAIATLGLGCIGLSGLGSLVLFKPVAHRNGWGSFKALGSTLLYLPLMFVHYGLIVVYDRNAAPYLGAGVIDWNRAWLRLAENLLIVIIILGLREHVVSLTARSLVMRTGRVDTQPLTALIGSLALASLADVMRLAIGDVQGLAADLLMTFELIMIAVGSFLFTLGLFGVGVDALRLRAVLLNPAPGLTDVIAEKPAGAGGRDAAG
ncbi:MAG: hypothetical protein H6810_09975 [Phycisphaeraceae bacterium]|nr:MAG: hypothetical protein H6810_09975 [Phycisphaeraceae bacterium]